ncbi:twin-arginine translocation signal domain-containing protein [Novosphingobium sp. JCM 18896]|uniref:twin-arginine translocation signal domain-containing protein n=1 Tax=Novosphingobium sp. JCM 18896 TaxID=2989731 RepID=UPI0022224187|nr:twin-arginine translocation signal domain-containing protein [Novosphingobium sp. JCM 18896]MCW1427795.1 twin-arginine translocation signal domain-containing protein [Novosphingobium sp. JCM 18896]
MNPSRRSFLTLAATAVPLAALGASSAWAAVCYDPATLPLSQKNRRRSIGYMDVAADPARRCAGCAFFTAAEEGCGKCLMLNAAVNAGASCGSFAPRGK